ncbi:MAG: hypothetical protein [Bacteriophage sp.]|nr:MAG: hypothetical protein [Bacteriophage sp.]
MRLSPLFVLPLLVTTWQTAFAATTDDCSKIKDDAERLACFDNISKQNEPSVSADAKGDEQKSKWEFRTKQSKMDDSISYSIKMLSDNQINEGANDNKYGTIFIACSKPFTTIAFTTGDLLNEYDGTSLVRYRLDKEQAKTTDMVVAKPNYAIGFWEEKKSVPFIKDMLGHEKIIVEIKRYGLGDATMEFSIKGIDEAIKPLRQACNW